MKWLKRKTPVSNWALVCFLILTVYSAVELAGRLLG